MRRLAAALALVALLAAGCGSDEDAGDVAGEPTGADTPTSTTAPASTEAPGTSEASTTSGTTEPPGASVTVPPASTAAAATSLAITVWELGEDGGPPVAYTLTCGPTGGDLPQPGAACAALQSGSVKLDEVAPDTICTEIYGGPAVATVQGTVDGEPLDARFSRVNGCQIDRWESATALLPADLSAWQSAPAATADSTTAQ